VLITATSLRPAYGGPAFSVCRLAAALGARGGEVGLWAADGSAMDTEPLSAAASVRRLDGPLRDAAAAFAPDLVHDNGLWLAHNHRIAELAREAGLPRVVSTRGMLAPWAIRHKAWKKKLAWELYQRRDLGRAAALHATAAPEAEQLAAYGLAAPIHTIPNGVDLPDLAPRRPGDQRTAVFLGRLYPVKGLPMLIEAWARVRPAGWRLVIAGPDEAGHRRLVEAAIAAAGLGDVVSLPGPIFGPAKTALLQETDLFVLPSHSESFGMAIAEALAHAAPVLTTTAVPWPALEARRCGWRVEPNPAAIEEGLRIAVGCDEPTLRRMGMAGRALVAETLGWDGLAERFLALYDSLAAAHGATPASRAAA
jgi:glycosyltransferase involved in cell wall biosynthesis